MKLYLNYFAMNLKSQMQYKASFLLSSFGQFVTAFTAVLGVYFILSRFNNVEGFEYEHVLLCFAVVVMSFSIGEMFGGGFVVFPRILGNGEFDRALVRPRNIMLQILVPKMDFTRIGLLIQAVAVLCYAIPKSGVAWTPLKIITLFFMILSGSFIFFALFLIYAACAFFTVEGLEFLNILTYGGRQFGRYPFSVYGKSVLLFLTFIIPLALFQYYPLLYLLDKEQGVFYMLSPLIGMLFIFPSHIFFKFGLSRYKSTGS